MQGLRNISYKARLTTLDLSSLENRESYFDLVECHKLIHGAVRCLCSEQLRLRHSNTRGHQYKLIANTSTLEVRFHFLTERVVNMWNSLPPDIVHITENARFKRLLRQHLQAY